MTAPLPDEVLQLLNHIEDVVGDEAWARIDAKLWNAVTALAVPAEAPNLPSLEWEGHQVWGDFTSLEAVRKAVRAAAAVAAPLIEQITEENRHGEAWPDRVEAVRGMQCHFCERTNDTAPICVTEEAARVCPNGVAPTRQYLHPTRVDALITVLEGECDGLSVTRETAEAILHYLENAPAGVAPSHEPQPVAWMTKSGFYPSHDCIPPRDLPPLGNPVPLYTRAASGVGARVEPSTADAIVQLACKWYDTGRGKPDVAHELALAVLRHKQAAAGVEGRTDV